VARKRINRFVHGEHLVTTANGDVRHSDQVTRGLYGAQRGQVVEIDDLDGPDAQTMQARSIEMLGPPRRLRGIITGRENDQ